MHTPVGESGLMTGSEDFLVDCVGGSVVDGIYGVLAKLDTCEYKSNIKYKMLLKDLENGVYFFHVF